MGKVYADEGMYFMSLKQKMTLFMVCPVLVFGLIAIGFILGPVNSQLTKDMEDSLKSTASATLAAYAHNAGEYYQSSNGELWKGSCNVSRSYQMVDKIRAMTGMEVTFFYGDQRVMTSAMDDSGNRLLGGRAGEKVVKEVLQGGREYFSDNVELDGKAYYGYYIPVEHRGEIIGMVFAGENKAEQDAVKNTMLLTMLLVVILILALCIGAAVSFAKSMINSLEKGAGTICAIGEGKLHCSVPEDQLERRDELGDMARAVDALRSVLRASLKNIGRHTEATVTRMRESAAQDLATAERQQEFASAARQDMDKMGRSITEVGQQTDALEEHAGSMRDNSREASALMKNLCEVNQKVHDAIQKIEQQTMEARSTAEAIANASALIINIAGQTNLLSLNASIEAARAGEMGRGFAVVAQEGKKLAEETGKASEEIEEIVKTLMDNTEGSRQLMSMTAEVLKEQDESIRQADAIFAGLLDETEASSAAIGQIAGRMKSLEKTRNNSLQAVEEMYRIVSENAANARHANEMVAEVTEKFTAVDEAAKSLSSIAEQLDASMKFFKADKE